MQVICPYCKRTVEKSTSAVNRSRKIGAPVYCGRTCAGFARRQWKSDAQKRLEKSEYDAEYRNKNAAKLRADKAARHKRTYDPASAAIERKKRMPMHVEYCRRPEYRAYKQQYDREYRAKEYGEF